MIWIGGVAITDPNFFFQTLLNQGLACVANTKPELTVRKALRDAVIWVYWAGESAYHMALSFLYSTLLSKETWFNGMCWGYRLNVCRLVFQITKVLWFLLRSYKTLQVTPSNSPWTVWPLFDRFRNLTFRNWTSMTIETGTGHDAAVDSHILKHHGWIQRLKYETFAHTNPKRRRIKSGVGGTLANNLLIILKDSNGADGC